MKTIANPFAATPLRTIYDNEAQKWWFSAIDICMTLTRSDYTSARKYWNNLKYEIALGGDQPVRTSDRLKLKAHDGKLRYTDVLDIRQILYLIQIVPSREAEPFRLWLAEAVAAGEDIAKQLEAIAKENTKATLDEIKVKDSPYERMTVVRTAFDVQ